MFSSCCRSVGIPAQVFLGASNSFEQSLVRCGWAPGEHHGERVCCGSSDRLAYVWDFETGKVMYALPGHAGAYLRCLLMRADTTGD